MSDIVTQQLADLSQDFSSSCFLVKRILKFLFNVTCVILFNVLSDSGSIVSLFHRIMIQKPNPNRESIRLSSMSFRPMSLRPGSYSIVTGITAIFSDQDWQTWHTLAKTNVTICRRRDSISLWNSVVGVPYGF